MAKRSLDALGQDEVIALRAIVRGPGSNAVDLDLRNVPVERRLDRTRAPRLEGGDEFGEGRAPGEVIDQNCLLRTGAARPDGYPD